MKSKRENLLSPSTSWRENPQSAVKNVTSDGCLPGFFHILFSKFNFSSNRRKSLTYTGSKKPKQSIAISDSATGTPKDQIEGRLEPDPAPVKTIDLGDRGSPPRITAGTRLDLIGALEKCDRDLAALQKTIDGIKTTLVIHHELPATSPIIHQFKFPKNDEGLEQQQQEEEEEKTKMAGDEVKNQRNTTRHVAKSNTNADITISYLNTNSFTRIKQEITKMGSSPPPVRSVSRMISKNMVESVEQVCADVAWGQCREVGKIGLSLHEHICRDLIDETVRELSPCLHRRVCSLSSLPLDACRRRLVF